MTLAASRGMDDRGSSRVEDEPSSHRRAARLTGFASRYGAIAALIGMIVFFSLMRPDSFPTVENLKSILTLAAPLTVVALGLTVILAMQDFDLSFGAMIGLGGATAVASMANAGTPWGWAIALAIALAIVVGVTNGILVAYLGGSSFIVTLGMSSVLIGIEFLITDQRTIFSGIPHGYTQLGQSQPFLGLNAEIWIAAALAIVMWAMLDHTEVGRYIYAIGGNSEAARLSGIRVRALRTVGFVIVAVLATVTGILITAQSASSTPQAGIPYLLPAYAAVFLGTAMLRPGEFNIPGTIVGVLFLGVIQDGLTMLQLSTATVNIVQGGVLVAAVMLSRLGQRAP